VARLRERTREELTAWRVSANTLRDAVLGVSELTSNAVLHAGGTATLHVTLAAGAVLVEVTDSSPSPPRSRLASEEDPLGGQGIPVVRALGSEWGYTFSGGVKTVWCQIPAGGATTVPIGGVEGHAATNE
jgi:anti-sigma regulatory factor (Ser/Thr protein kinase)